MKLAKRLRRLLLAVLIAVITIFLVQHSPFKNRLPSYLGETEGAAPVHINADSAILMSYNNGDILYEKNADQAFPAASMTKIMVEYLVLQAVDHHELSWDSRVPVSHYAYSISSHPGFSHVPLKEGQTYTVRELYDAMAIHSANGATIALAEKIAGSEKQFVKLMNQTAESMELKQTKFVNSTGLNNRDLGKFYSMGSPTADNQMSAKDLARLACTLIQEYPDVLDSSEKAVETFASQGNPYRYYNTNWMLPHRGIQDQKYSGVDGLKTGFTDRAGYCFTGTAKRSHHRFISVVMGTHSKTARFEETEKLFDYGFHQLAK